MFPYLQSEITKKGGKSSEDIWSECREQANKLTEMKSAENHFCIFILTSLRFTVINLFVPFSSDC